MRVIDNRNSQQMQQSASGSDNSSGSLVSKPHANPFFKRASEVMLSVRPTSYDAESVDAAQASSLILAAQFELDFSHQEECTALSACASALSLHIFQTAAFKVGASIAQSGLATSGERASIDADVSRACLGLEESFTVSPVDRFRIFEKLIS
jgi:hypothetical protein